MKLNRIFLLMLVVPMCAFGAGRGDGAVRTSVNRVGLSVSKAKPVATNFVAASTATKELANQNLSASETADSTKKQIGDMVSDQVEKQSDVSELGDESKEKIDRAVAQGNDTDSVSGNDDCRDVYRECMDNFCLLDENQGERCACSDNINRAKSKLQEVLDIQAEADKLFTEGVEREKLDAKARRLVFTESTTGNSKVSGKTFMSWLYDSESEDDDEDVGEDLLLGNALYDMAAEYCANELKSCGNKAEMEEMLYSRMITQDCKNYDMYLKEQKANAESNKRTAESAVRAARLEMLDTNNKYNRGECLLAYRSCIADKGGCGTNFENCLDANLLKRRANACENILDQCTAVRDYVQKDWTEESKTVLAEAAKYADKNERLTCLARVQNCLEDGCSTSTNAECLSDLNVAAGVCPVINECDAKIPGFQAVVNDKLKYLRTKFCENDIGKCLQERCGVDFTKPECVGKSANEIAALCPQDMFPSCKNAEQYDIILQAALLRVDYQLMQGCINQFSEKLSSVCGMDMACLPASELLIAKDDKGNALDMTKWVDLDRSAEGTVLKTAVAKSAEEAVEKFFEVFDQDLTLSACRDIYGQSSTKIKGKNSLKDSVNLTAKFLAVQSAKNRASRALYSLMDELRIKEETDAERKECLEKYKAEKAPDKEGTYTYIRSVSYEKSLHSCHVCRMQRVCEEGGESKATSALKAAGGGLAAGAGAGTMVNAGWGTAIGAVIGTAGAGVLGYMSGGKKEFCQEIESCEDINVSK